MECLIPGRFATRGPLAILILVGLLQTGASVLLIRNVGHLLTVSPETVSVWTLAIPLMAVAILAACRLAEMWQAERLAQRIIHAQRSMLARHLLKLPPRSPKSSRSEVLLRFMGEMSALRSWHMRAVPVLLIGIPVVVGGLVALGFRDPRLSLAVVLPVIASIILQITLSSRHFKTAEHTRRTRTRLARNVSRHFEALPALNAFGRTAKAEREIEKHSASFSEAMIGRAWDAGLLRASAEFGANGTIISVLAIWFLAPGYDPSALAGALVFVALLSPKLRALGRVPEQFNLARIAARRIEAFMTEAPLDAREDSAGIARRAGRLKLRDVGIAGLFEGFHATAEPGARVLLEGPNGAGKSRLLGLIAGLEDPDTGRIVLDGRDTGLRRRASLCKLVAMAGSGMPLAAGRVEDNLNYGDRVSEGERDRILTLCRWQQLEASLPQGRRTQIETGAPNLSTGQRARIGLIRALLRRPRILLLDEIDSTLDAEGREILEEIIAWFDGTVMIASHDTRWRQVVDTVWTLPTQNSKLFGREVQADV